MTEGGGGRRVPSAQAGPAADGDAGWSVSIPAVHGGFIAMTARILIVDDVASNTRLLEAKLTAEYYQTATGHNGPECLRLARSWQPDLILLDVMMPEMDGYECCRRLKDDPQTLHIPVVMVTALGEPSERLQGIEAGADDFLTKPVEYDTLLGRVRGLVRLKRLLDEWRARGETARALGLSGDVSIIPSVSGARALVVDDWDAGIEQMQEALSREGILAGRARDEAEALALTSAIPFDLIVLSLSMRTNDPLRLASRFRADDATRDIPLLLVAESEQRARLLRGFDLGANDWVLRPVEDNELRARARNQIRRKFYQDRLRADLGHALEMALTDPLTGLYNQRYLLRHLRGLLAGDGAPEIALVVIDVDRFKSINDSYGHAAGDRTLKAVADTLRAHTRMFDSVGRHGGDEFVVVMPGTSAVDAASAAERLRSAVAELVVDPECGPPQVTISIGLSCTAGKEMTAEALLVEADAALYAAKRAGRNRVETAPSAGQAPT
jgi:two-component system cell cycle response regulator